MSVVQDFNLNIIPDSGPVVVHVDQYDQGDGRLVAHLYKGDIAYSPSGTVAVQGTKPDGKGFDYAATLSGNTVTMNLTNQMTAVAGSVRTQVVVTETSGRTGTFVFIIDVQKSALPDDTDMSESDYQLVEELIEEAEQASSDSEAWAVGERGGVPVTSDDPTYHNNAEYWAGVAQTAVGDIIANSETETSAHAYAIGDQFIYNGILYTATASISIGETITPGTNCTASDKIVDQLEDKADLVGGKVPADQLPSYVDDVIEGYYYNSKFYEEAAHTTEITPETGKIYVDLSTDVTYRWSGSAYIALSNPDIANDAVTAITASTAEYPVPAVNELLKVIIGKINKFLDDLKTKKADKVSSATNGNFAGLDSSGNLTDSGKKASDFATSSAGVPTGGTTGQVLKKRSGTNYDTEWGEASSGGHTILNSSGTAMTQRGKLQFVGADVVDDSANDKTIVTTTPQSMIGDAWADGVSYVVGDYCIDGDVLYKCKTAHTSNSSNRPPYVSYWDAVSVASQFGGGGGVDETVFSDYQNFTKPTPQSSRWSTSNLTGGYKVVGNLVYVYMIFSTVNISGSTDDYWALSPDMPTPKLPEVPLEGYSYGGGFYNFWVMNPTNTGYLYMRGNPSNYTVNKKIVIKGVYEKV